MAEKKKNNRSGRKQEILGIFIMSTAVLVFLGIVSYHPSDYPGSGNTESFHNWFGQVGAVVSHALYVYTIGYACLVFPVILFLLGWRLLLQTAWRSFFRSGSLLIAYGLFFSVALAMPQAASESGSSIGYRFSGLFGGFLAEMLVRYLGTPGSIVVLFTALLALLMTSTSWNVRETVIRFKEAVESLRASCREAVASRWASWRESRVRKDDAVGRPVGTDRDLDEDGDSGAEPETPVRRPVVPAAVHPPAMTVVKKPEIRTGDEDFPRGMRPRPAAAPLEHGDAESEYLFPPIDLLSVPRPEERRIDKQALENKAHFLEEKLKEFDILGQVVEIMPGPIITRFEVRPAPGVKVSRFIGIQDDLALVMQAQRVRVAPIPGKAVVGVEVPNESPSDVALREILESRAFAQSASKLTVALGKTIEGIPYVADLSLLPHLLVAGATGSGKSVCLNTIITSILYRARPSEV
jgi:S-DNA-T family DNA segregation ATPase FtsK/SpoIIIE